ncbi:MAG: hypothetical protein ISS15_11085 [Alphaproteobacteria bacterium]|nr:hypothetical protein [Alphaproteobacteria bacterium]MBL6940347.1 hypothetical protein [Alphaproteobacteria bacterium]MBL7098195.1 hypothetical protein [Alphaproteobacteria bacterium]
MTHALAFRISLAGAVIVLALAIYSAFSPAMVACGALQPSYSPVIAQELSRSVADVQQIFGAAPSACRTAIARRIDLVTWVDSLAFIPAYGAFLLFFFMGLAERDRQSAFIGFVLSAVACGADYLENVCLFAITAHPDADGFALAFLPWATGLKWLALGLGGAVGGTILIQSGRMNYPAAALCGLSFLGTVLGIANPHLFGPYISNAITAIWVVFLVVDVRQVIASFSAVPQLEPGA